MYLCKRLMNAREKREKKKKPATMEKPSNHLIYVKRDALKAINFDFNSLKSICCMTTRFKMSTGCWRW